MRAHVATAAGVLLLLTATAGTMLTGYSIVHDGFPVAHAPSLFHAGIRVVAGGTALILWPIAKGRLERLVLASWILAAGSSAVHYGLDVSTTALEVVRALTHLLAYATSAIAIARRLHLVKAVSAGS